MVSSSAQALHCSYLVMVAPSTREARTQQLISQGFSPSQAAAHFTHQSGLIRHYLSIHPEVFTEAERSALVKTWTTMQYQMIGTTVGCWLAVKAFTTLYPRALGRFGRGTRYGVWLGVVIGPSLAVYQVKKTLLRHLMDNCINDHWDEISQRLQRDS